ncbi:MBOAT family protein [Cronobacter sakazakii]|uniref:MBOAT family O-acyltransferase n=1 Tax=Cronobacter sakazakii TaxID=28141 RepID=UPI001AE5E73F|nr:MBOAT family O-acyltransferase [Cronobacter sakazakii]EKK3980405.1 MBOAT family protein [Cronobacter sakazakii]EKM6345466.1 MBOAT family protein [Cronobacter sakazakii]EKM6353988.1 MBOAT family protein [Cronobacter sakazakii]EKM6370102.1 MBOAT family protein [Cronobacter sakazakii]EKM6378404.1 MBOAT family protein [Cronobacter sakazakii]
MAELFTPEFLLGFMIFFIVYWLVAPWLKLQNFILLIAGYWLLSQAGWEVLLIHLSFSLCVLFLILLSRKTKLAIYLPSVLIAIVVIYFFIFKCFSPIMVWGQGIIDTLTVNLQLPMINIQLPLGLSFYLFNAISLVIAVVRGDIRDVNMISVLLYMNFMPTIIAGPINRATWLMPQIDSAHRSIKAYQRAIWLIVLAIVKLFWLSAWLDQQFVTGIFFSPLREHGLASLAAVYGWAWEIYFNFSGYTNLVSGIALLLGYQIGENFQHPYLAANIQDFWHRWHISLSTFIRDYIYIPLGGNRKGIWRTQLNVMIAMILSGLWHGVGGTFIVWGALHGLGVVIYNVWTKQLKERWSWIIPPIIARLLTFNFVCLAWVFFKANSVSDALLIVENIYTVHIESISSASACAVITNTLLIVIYPSIIKLRMRCVPILNDIKWYAIPLVVIPALTITFILAPAGIPGFIYAGF